MRADALVLREDGEAPPFEGIVGSSAPLRAVLSNLSKVAPTDSTVLITGESGTGKELVARAIHGRSRRASRSFVSVNCAAIPSSLITSELFGHEKGAFTGALQRRAGRFELAEGGTLFLDEVGELPLEAQIALLRVLQEREVERLGSDRAIRTDVRVVAATNRNLDAANSKDAFRKDLFYRLSVFPIEMPPLRERREDIPMLIRYFVERYSRIAGKRFKRVSPESVEMLRSYSWPGNIRELQNIIQRSVIMSESDTLSVEERWLHAKFSGRYGGQSLAEYLSVQERAMIVAALTEARGLVSGRFGAAVKLGIPASTLESKIKSFKIDKTLFKLGDLDSCGASCGATSPGDDSCFTRTSQCPAWRAASTGHENLEA